MEWEIYSMSLIDVRATFIFDLYSILFFFTLILVCSIIFLFSQFYIDVEKNVKRFIMLLVLFVISIVFLIFSPRLLFLLVGWDGLGITSYFLIVFYINYRRSVAGILTFLVNRLGDVFFFLSICCLSFILDWKFLENNFFFFIISSFIVITFITKRAQIPFSSWLPAAISAPTPVSSLVHSSTLVTAGVYLLVRFSSMLTGSCTWLFLLSVLTIIIAGVIANIDMDLKKVVAFSTLRQLGFIVSSYCCSLVIFCFFHLLTHALFKASLFMCSGVIIHRRDNRQDYRNRYNYSFSSRVLKVSIFVCLLCLCGVPFTSGFFSKDLILDGSRISVLIFFFFLGGVVLTFVYSLRFCFFLIWSKDFFRGKVNRVNENIFYVLGSIVILVLRALFFGFLWFERIVWFSVVVLVSVGWKLFYWITVMFIVYCFLVFISKFYFLINVYMCKQILYLSKIFSLSLFKLNLKISRKLVYVLDHGWIEKFGPAGVYLVLFKISLYFYYSCFLFFISFLRFFFLIL